MFIKLINHLFNEVNSPHERKLPNGKNKNDKRRQIKFFEKTLMFYYYKAKIPTDMLDNKFSIEHIIPNSSDWDGKLDKDATGNLIPIPLNINCQRGNRHINLYRNTKIGKDFFEFIKDIIPNDTDYDKIIKYSDRKASVIDNNKYNILCKKNETIYLENLVSCLFR